MKLWFSAKELVGIGGLSKHPSNVNRQARKEKWQSQPLKGVKGGGVEYALSSLPQAVQDEIYRKFAVTVVKSKPKAPLALRQVDLKTLTAKQRDAADARMALVVKVLELEQAQPRYKAVKFLCEQIKHGEVSAELMRLVELANNKKGKNRTLSDRTLNQWVLDYEKADTPEARLKALAPMKRMAKKAEDVWYLSWFLGIFRQKNALSVAESYRYFCAEWQERYHEQPDMLDALPSLDQVRHALNKLPKHILQKGRLSGSKYKQLLPYVERDWSPFAANDIWIGDGHSLKMKVAHPIHGRPFTPELTMIVDGASRKIVGWSLALAENGFAVLDALRHSIQTHGVPAIYYSDNGGGEKNKLLDAEITGILPRFSIHHATGIAGNPQGRGIIERLNKTVGLRIAEQFETYYGKNADPEATRKMLARQLAYSNGKGTQLTAKQQKARRELPTWEELKAVIAEVIHWYNHEHIHRKIGCTPAEKYQRVCNPDLMIYLSENELRDIQRPAFIRTTQRGLIEWNKHKYFHLDLLNYQGQEVMVCVDIHNPNWVQVRTKEGSFICNAEFEAHKRNAFPIPFVEQKQQQRAEGMKKRAANKIALAEAELNPVITIEHQPSFELLRTKAKPKEEPTPIFLTRVQKEAWEARKKLVNE
ncbi:transposase [Rodentibacter genomosp. 1]|uniref:Transposase n=1 Tax=Rodentibacter genomosp. 1 TaxID=1908264 RepID=A0A1V3J545_9PAST|nr:Mu transposase C-terminal domain-containing protein [Rodentibacter genomosp. 1]OOF50299.1 transposase [Rodentibacter genomosp. 1]